MPAVSSREEVRRLIGAFAAGSAQRAAPSAKGDVVVDLSRITDVAAALRLAAVVRVRHEVQALSPLENTRLGARALASREADHGCDDLRAAP